MKDTVKLFLLILLLPLLTASAALWQSWRCTAALSAAPIEWALPGVTEGTEAAGDPQGQEPQEPTDPLSWDSPQARTWRIWSWAGVLPLWTGWFSAASALLGLAQALSVLHSARRARLSQDQAAYHFALQLRRLPWFCLAQAVLISLILASLGGFELLALAARSSLETVGRGGASLLILLLLAVVLLCRLLWEQLRLALRDFLTLRPLELMGRRLSRDQHPALFDLTDGLARQLGAQAPQNIVIGLDGGFFMADRPIALKNGDHPTGRSLHIWLPALEWLNQDQFQALLVHELALYREGQGAYRSQLLPVYHQILRNLDRSDPDSDRAYRSWLAGPVALVLGFLTGTFAPVLEEWDHRCELEADGAAAALLGSQAIASALIRCLALTPAADGALEELATGGADDPKGRDFRRLMERHVGQWGLNCALEDLGQNLFYSPLTVLERLQALDMEPQEELLREICAPGPSGLLEGIFAGEVGRRSISQLEEEYSSAAEVARHSHREGCLAALEQTAEAQEIYENTQLSTAAGAMVGLVGLGAGTFLLSITDLRDLGGALPLLLCSLGGGLGGLMFSIHCFRRGQKPVMTLSPQGLMPRNFDVIPWAVIQDVRSVVTNGMVSVTLKLQHRYVPHRRGGIQLPGRKKGFLTFSGGRLRSMSWRQALQLLQLYRAAWYAHRELKR